jgi:hypothetical protein
MYFSSSNKSGNKYKKPKLKNYQAHNIYKIKNQNKKYIKISFPYKQYFIGADVKGNTSKQSWPEW